MVKVSVWLLLRSQPLVLKDLFTFKEFLDNNKDYLFQHDLFLIENNPTLYQILNYGENVEETILAIYISCLRNYENGRNVIAAFDDSNDISLYIKVSNRTYIEYVLIKYSIDKDMYEWKCESEILSCYNDYRTPAKELIKVPKLKILFFSYLREIKNDKGKIDTFYNFLYDFINCEVNAYVVKLLIKFDKLENTEFAPTFRKLLTMP
jgi:hypothetical protein